MAAGNETALAYRAIPNHPRELLDRLPWALRQDDRLPAIVLGWGDMIQMYEEMHFSVLQGRTLAKATGVDLERWGEIVGEKRNGLGDGWYRRIIMARGMVNNYPGTDPPIDAFISLVRAATNPEEIRYYHHNWCGFRVQVGRVTFIPDMPRRRIAQVLARAATPGGLQVTEYLTQGGWATGSGALGAALLGRRIYATP